MTDILGGDHVEQATGLSAVLSREDEHAILTAIAQQNPHTTFDELAQISAKKFLKRVDAQIESREVKLEELDDQKTAVDRVAGDLKILRRLSLNSRYPDVDFSAGFHKLDLFTHSFEQNKTKLENDITFFKKKKADELKLAPVREQVRKIRHAGHQREQLTSVPALVHDPPSHDDDDDYVKPTSSKKHKSVVGGSSTKTLYKPPTSFITLCLLVSLACPMEVDAAFVQQAADMSPFDYALSLVCALTTPLFCIVFFLMLAEKIFKVQQPRSRPPHPSRARTSPAEPDQACPLCLEPIAEHHDFVTYPCFHRVHTGREGCGGHQALLSSGRTLRCPVCRLEFDNRDTLWQFSTAPSPPRSSPIAVIPAGSPVLIVALLTSSLVMAL